MANDLTLTSAAFDTAGQKYGSAALSGGYGVAPGGIIATGPFAWECWCKRAAPPSSLEVIMGQSGLGWIGMKPDGTVQCEIGTNPPRSVTSSSGNKADGAWHHVAVSCDGGTMSLFVDGALAGSIGVTLTASNFAVSGTPPTALGTMAVRNHGGSLQYPFGGEVDEAVVWSNNRYAAAFAPATAAYSGTEAGLIALWHLDGNGSDATAVAAAILPGNPAIVYSPYTWAGGKTINPGAYLRMVFSGSSVSLTFDVSAQSAPLPQVWISIDGQPAQPFVIAPTVTPSMPSATAGWPRHTLELVVKATSEFVSRWSTQAAAVVLTGIGLGNGGVASAPTALPRNILIFGDSITEGYHAVSGQASPSDTDGSDAALGWAYALRRLLGAEVGVVGFGGTGLLGAGQGGVPPLGQSFGALWSGQSRSFVPAPALIVINEGENDRGAAAATFQLAFQSFLGALLAAVPSCPVAVLRPFSGAQAGAIQAAIAAAANPRVRYVDTTGLFDTTLSVDGQHPLGVANLSSIGPGLAALLAPLLAPAGTIVNRWTHF